MSDFDAAPSPDSTGALPCPNCGTPLAPNTLYCPHCGMPSVAQGDARQSLKMRWMPFLIALPAISIAALGSCVASATIVGGVFFWGWRVALMGVCGLIASLLLARLLQFLNR